MKRSIFCRVSRRFEIPREIRSIEDAYYHHTRDSRTTEFNLILASSLFLWLSILLVCMLLYFPLILYFLICSGIFRLIFLCFFFLTGNYLILSILFGHRLLLRLPLALVPMILKPYFYLQCEKIIFPIRMKLSLIGITKRKISNILFLIYKLINIYF